MNKSYLLLSWSIVIILFSILGCSNPKTSFDKHSYIKECGLSLDGKLLSPEVADSIILEVLKEPNLDDDIKSSLYLFLKKGDYISCDSVCYALSNEDISNEENEEKLRHHFLCVGYTLSSSAKELLDITLSYAKKAPVSLKKKIGECSFNYAESISDTLTARSVLRIVEALTGDNNSITSDNAEDIIKWCKIGIPVIKKAFNDNSLMIYLSEAGYKSNDIQADEYADSLVSYMINGSISDESFYSGGAIKKRFYSALEKHEYTVAERIIDHFMDDLTNKEFLERKNQRDLKQYVKERLWPNDYTDSSQILTIKSYNEIVRAVYEATTVVPEGHVLQYYLEKARLLYYQRDSSFADWLTAMYFHGIDDTFPSMAHWINFDSLLFPSYLYYPQVMALMSYQYNSPDTRNIYNASLYIKGTSDFIPIQIYKAVKQTSNKNIKAYADSIRNGLEPIGALTKRDTLVKDSLEVNLANILVKCLYSWEDIKTNLKNDEVAIEFLACPSLDLPKRTIYKAVILRNDIDYPFKVDLCDENQIKKELQRRSNDNGIYDIIWKPLEDFINKGESIYYSTDGLLNLINIQAIKGKDGSYIMDNYQLCQVSSTREILSHEERTPLSSIALFGGLEYSSSFTNNQQTKSLYRKNKTSRGIYRDALEYLPKSIEEVKAISGFAKDYGIENTCLMGESGTEEAFYATSSHQPDILHIATHGFYYSKTESSYIDYFDKRRLNTPLDRCGIVLSRGKHVWAGESVPEGSEDGILLGSEIIGLDLDGVDLVVLSACNTALGDISGEGVAGLRQAFKRAGVKSLLMTLSKVDDEATAFFMTTFYENLFSGKDKHTSYKEAINTMRSSGRFSDPKYWSPFILVD